VRLALVQLNPTIGAFAANVDRALEALREARSQGAELALLSELAITGYPPLDLLERGRFVELAVESELRLVNELPDGMVTVFGNLTKRPAGSVGRPLYNSAVAARRGEVLLRVHKALLPVYDVFDEARYFEPGALEGPHTFEFGGHRIGLTVCEDLWNDKDFWADRLYTQDPAERLIDDGASLILNLSSSPWSRGKEVLRRRMFGHAATRHGVHLAFANQVGGNDGLVFDGRSAVFGRGGELRAEAPAWREHVEVVDIGNSARFEPAPTEEIQEIRSALVLGIRDYFAKCGIHRAIIALSGGIDSAVTAYLAVAALGSERVTGLALPSRYSSPGSVSDARALADNLGIVLHTIPIEGAFSALLDGLAGPFDGREPDVTEENIQSRIRGLLVMALANKNNALVITTGNKSEAAVGYCTLYGDTNGGLAPLADLYKHQVYALAHLANRETEVIPKSSISKPPSAELRPDQLDQDSLPPYDVLDEILRLLIERRATIPEIVAGSGATEAVVRDIVRKVHQNEFKRKQFATTLRVSEKAWVGRIYPLAHHFRE
jgi:NAD+ synthase/NAD+ synthase (glutamine-hydrolysing)